MMPKINFNPLKPDEAIKYIKGKGLKLSFHYDEIVKQAHHKVFTVAKITRLDLLNDMHEAVQQSIKDGTPFETFKKNIKPNLQKKGWWGLKDITNPKTGEVKEVYIGSKRLKNILATNKQVAYATGRYKQQKGFKNAIFLQYKALKYGNRRDNHKSKHNIVKHRDDIWWQTNYPPNGWGCKCFTLALSKKDIDRKNLKINNDKLSDIAHKDWSYHVGDTSKLHKIEKMNLDKSLNNLPVSSKQRKYANMNNDELLNTFYAKMGINKGDTYIDKVGDPMVIDDSLFRSGTGELKIKKRDRHLLLEQFSEVIKEPDEIYLEWDNKANRLIKKMFKFLVVNNKTVSIQAIFEYNKDKTQGVTLYHINSKKTINNKRIEKLIYRKESD